MLATTNQAADQNVEKTSPLAVRVAVFDPPQGKLEDYTPWIYSHLFPTLRTVPGYMGVFLGRDAENGHLISISIWQSTAAAIAGEDAIGRVARTLPAGTVPRPSKVEKYIVEHLDGQAALLK